MLLTLLGAACGSGSGSTAATSGDATRPGVQLDQIAPAIRAVEAELGGTQRYSEVNATPSEVNVFVVDLTGAESAWLYRDGRLAPPPEGSSTALPADAPTFAAADVAFEPDTVLAQLTRELVDSQVVSFSVQPALAGGTQLVTTLVSPNGGALRVLLAPDGSILGAQPDSG